MIIKIPIAYTLRLSQGRAGTTYRAEIFDIQNVPCSLFHKDCFHPHSNVKSFNIYFPQMMEKSRVRPIELDNSINPGRLVAVNWERVMTRCIGLKNPLVSHFHPFVQFLKTSSTDRFRRHVNDSTSPTLNTQDPLVIPEFDEKPSCRGPRKVSVRHDQPNLCNIGI